MGTPTQTGSLVFQLVYTGGEKGALVPARGLFVLFAPAVTPRDPTKFSLAFCNVYGVPVLVPAQGNPWPLALPGGNKRASKGKSAVCVALDIPHDFVCIAHPSPDYARGLLASLIAGKSPNGSGTWDAAGAWPFQTLTPECDPKGIRFYMPETPELYLPKGAGAYGGWSLYYRMPYGHLDAVKQQTRKLAAQLGGIYYPAGLGTKPPKGSAAPIPYPQTPDEHDGELDTAVAAALHRFQNDLAVGRAHRLDPDALASVSETKPEVAELRLAWKRLFGREINVTAAGVAQVGMSDELTSRYLEQWKADGLRMPGVLLVPLHARGKQGATVMHGQPQLWWRCWVVDELSKALGAVYPLSLGNSHRNIDASGVGQASASNHKLGRAFDLGFDNWVEPAASMPVAFEADWHDKKRAGLTPRWLLYMHSTLDPISTPPEELTAVLGPELDAAQARIEARIQESTGGPPGPGAPELIAKVAEVVLALKTLAAQPGDAQNSTALGRDYFRREVQRFQWQGGQPDVGDVTAAISAERDGLLRGLRQPIRTFLNLSRLAYQVGLHPIGAQSGFKPVALNPGDTVASQRIKPAAVKSRVAKAIELDQIAEGVERAVAVGMAINLYDPRIKPKPTKPPTPKPPDHTLDAAGFDLNALRRWMARTSDHPDDLPHAQASPLMTYPDDGVELTMQVVLEVGEQKDYQAKFLQAREAIRVRVLQIGAGLRLRQGSLTTNDELPISTLHAHLANFENVPGESDHTIVLRPMFHANQPDDDPGLFEYEVPKLADPQKLEWWHFELPNEGKAWEDLAEAIGLAKESIAAPAVPTKDTVGPAWQGGAGYTKAPYANDEPENASHLITAPGPE